MFVPIAAEFKVQGVRDDLAQLEQYLARAAREGTAAHVVEAHIFRQVLAFGGKCMGAFLELVGPGDLGPTVELGEGQTLKRWPQPTTRRLLTVFGAFSIPRCVYGTRPNQKIELVPTDQRLQLPESEVSYLLQDWDQLLGIDQAFGAARDVLKKMLGIGQSVDTLERGNQQMAEAAEAFRQAQGAPEPKEEGALLVVSEDNKGVPMVRPQGHPVPAGCHRSKGEKANKKQMACIGCVYTVDAHPRTPEEMVATLFRDPERRQDQPPKACQKRYWASLSRREGQEFVCAQDEVFQHLRDDIALRRQPGQILVHLSDGQRSLELDRRKYLPRDDLTVDILDLMHVAPRLWEAAHLFHPEGSDQATQFVRQRMLRVLQGHAGRVIGGLRQMGVKHDLDKSKSARLAKLCKFLESNLHRMHYDQYLRAGYPIATGVIEGACQHVIKDRMERAGMRWKVPGAMAMLQLRVIHANGDWDRFLEHRIGQENARLYPHADVLETIQWPLVG